MVLGRDITLYEAMYMIASMRVRYSTGLQKSKYFLHVGDPPS